MKWMRTLALWGAVLMLLSACTAQKPPLHATQSRADDLRAAFLAKADTVTVSETAVTFSDALGRICTVPCDPARVIGLYASYITLWYEAGGRVDGCIGGSSAVEMYTAQIGRDITADDGMTVVATSAAARKWDVERIIAMQPSLILCSTAMDGYSTVEGPAAAAGIAVVAVDYENFEDYLKWFKVFCHLNGRPDLWESVAMPVLDEVVGLLSDLPAGEAPSVFSMFSDTTALRANTANTVVGEMLALMGADNIADAGQLPAAERIDINLEAVYAADPDCIVVQCHRDAALARQAVEDTYGDNPVWQVLRAVREGRVYYLDRALFHYKPNCRFAEAYRTLAEILYPGLREHVGT